MKDGGWGWLAKDKVRSANEKANRFGVLPTLPAMSQQLAIVELVTPENPCKGFALVDSQYDPSPATSQQSADTVEEVSDSAASTFYPAAAMSQQSAETWESMD